MEGKNIIIDSEKMVEIDSGYKPPYDLRVKLFWSDFPCVKKFDKVKMRSAQFGNFFCGERTETSHFFKENVIVKMKNHFAHVRDQSANHRNRILLEIKGRFITKKASERN